MEEVRFEKQPVSKTYVLLTVDTEADIHKGQIVPFEQMVFCRINGVEYGIHRMMDLADRFGATMTFFVSVFEHRRMGIKPVMRVCKEIDKRGHEVQLHTHPNWIYDHRFMWGYPLKRQVEFIHEGKEVICEAIGKYPVAHRAGGFGSNEDTLVALKENGILLDSTYLFGNYSRLDPNTFPLNGVGECQGVVEIPVTVFQQFSLGRFNTYRPFDINSNSLSELLFVLEEAKRSHLPVANLLMHSFSFVKRSRDRQKIHPNLHDLKKFESLLEYIHKDKVLEAIGIGEFYNKLQSNSTALPLKGEIPNSGVIRTAARACRYPLRGKANMIIVSTLAVCILLFVCILFFLLL